MTCGCSALESSPLMAGGAKRKRSTSSKRKSTTTKRKSTTTKRKSTTTKRRVRRMKGGGDDEALMGTRIPLAVQASTGWMASPNTTPKPVSIDLGEASQSWIFGRPTPDGKDFMVASGLVQSGPSVTDISMTGGKKKRATKKRTTKRKVTKKGKKRSTKKGGVKKRSTKKRSTKKRSTRK